MLIGEAFVELRPQVDARQFEREAERDIGRAAGNVGEEAGEQFSRGFSQTARRAAVGLGSIIGTAVFARQIGEALDAASGLQEQANVTGLVFKELRGEIDALAETSAQSFGLSERAFRQSAARIGGALQTLGTPLEEAIPLTETLIERAVDLGSAFDIDPSEAIQAVISGLQGEVEPLRRVNVFLSDQRVRQEAVRLGYAETAAAADNYAKAQAAVSLILQDSADVQGDFANTSELAANALRISSAEAENAQASFGENLLPAYKELIQRGGQLAQVFAAMPGPIQLVTVALIGLGVAAPIITNLVDVFRRLQTAATRLPLSFNAATVALRGFIAAAGAAIVIDRLGAAIGDVKAQAEEFVTSIQSRFDTIPEQIAALTNELEAQRRRRDEALAFGDIPGLGSVPFLRDAGSPAFVAANESVKSLELRIELLNQQLGENERQGRLAAGGIDEFGNSAAGAATDVYSLTNAAGDAASALRDVLQAAAQPLFIPFEVSGQQRDVVDAVFALADAKAEQRRVNAGLASSESSVASAQRSAESAARSLADAQERLNRARADLADFRSPSSQRIRELRRTLIVEREVGTREEALRKELDLLEEDQRIADEQQRLLEAEADAVDAVADAQRAAGEAASAAGEASVSASRASEEAAGAVEDAQLAVVEAIDAIAQAEAERRAATEEGAAKGIAAIQAYRDVFAFFREDLREAGVDAAVLLEVLAALGDPRAKAFLFDRQLSRTEIEGILGFESTGTNTRPAGLNLYQENNFYGGADLTPSQLDAANREAGVALTQQGAQP